jgi:leucyl/phenylalanyl-tRNA--protein transferase
MMQGPFWLDSSPASFPPTYLASREPDGLLAIGGELSPKWLLKAYYKGIFPWFNPGEPILWWSPNPRSVINVNHINVRKSLKKRTKQYVNQRHLEVKFDHNFMGVMQACSEVPRPGQDGTWITSEMTNAYNHLHKIGHAHSVEVYLDGQLSGGLYGVQIGRMFYGESMFAKVPDTSKIGLACLGFQLKKWGFEIIDCQIETPHLNSMGAFHLDRDQFEQKIAKLCNLDFYPARWTNTTIDPLEVIAAY